MRNFLNVDYYLKLIYSCMETLNQLLEHRGQFAKSLIRSFLNLSQTAWKVWESLVLSLGKININKRGCAEVCDSHVVCKNQEQKVHQ